MTRQEPLWICKEATGCPLLEGNASPVSPRSCCQNVASRFDASLPLSAIERGFRAQVDVKGKLAEWFLYKQLVELGAIAPMPRICGKSGRFSSSRWRQSLPKSLSDY